MNQVLDAIEAAAESGDGRLDWGATDRRATSSRRRIGATRNTIMRFLENLPDDLTVLELREAIEIGEE